jgi:hypothetical protein
MVKYLLLLFMVATPLVRGVDRLTSTLDNVFWNTYGDKKIRYESTNNRFDECNYVKVDLQGDGRGYQSQSDWNNHKFKYSTLRAAPVVGSTVGVIHDSGRVFLEADSSGTSVEDLSACGNLCYQWNLNISNTQRCVAYNKYHPVTTGTAIRNSYFGCQLLNYTFTDSNTWWEATTYGTWEKFGWLDVETTPRCNGHHMTEAEKDIYRLFDDKYQKTCSETPLESFTNITLVNCKKLCVDNDRCTAFSFYNANSLEGDNICKIFSTCTEIQDTSRAQIYLFVRKIFNDLTFSDVKLSTGCGQSPTTIFSDQTYNAISCYSRCETTQGCEVSIVTAVGHCEVYSTCTEVAAVGATLFKVDPNPVVLNEYILTVQSQDCAAVVDQINALTTGDNPTKETTVESIGDLCLVSFYSEEGGYDTIVDTFGNETLENERVVTILSKSRFVRYSDIYNGGHNKQGFPTKQKVEPIWSLDRITADEGFTPKYTGEGVTIYVIDTGIYDDNLYISDNSDRGKDFVRERDDRDLNGHGTHVTGTAVSNTFGVARGAQAYGIKIISETGIGAISTVLRGIVWAVKKAREEHAILSLSLGLPRSFAVNSALQTARSLGVGVVVAAGNSNKDACEFSPSSAGFNHSIITVGASTEFNSRAAFSNWGPCVDIFAPGENIMSSWIGGGDAVRTISGTSMATPMVSGALALFLEKNNYNLDEAERELLNFSLQGALTGTNGSPNLLLQVPSTTVAPTTSPTVKIVTQTPDEQNNVVIIAAGASTAVVTVAAVLYYYRRKRSIKTEYNVIF